MPGPMLDMKVSLETSVSIRSSQARRKEKIENVSKTYSHRGIGHWLSDFLSNETQQLSLVHVIPWQELTASVTWECSFKRELIIKTIYSGFQQTYITFN